MSFVLMVNNSLWALTSYNLIVGEAVDLSLDHKPLDPIELARIEKAGGHVDEDLRVDGGLNLSRAIGMQLN